jgi:hypothetical protein
MRRVRDDLNGFSAPVRCEMIVRSSVSWESVPEAAYDPPLNLLCSRVARAHSCA